MLWWHRSGGPFGEGGELRSASCFQMIRSSLVHWKTSGDKSHRLLAESSFCAPHQDAVNREVLA
jgi:hypothetical protein